MKDHSREERLSGGILKAFVIKGGRSQQYFDLANQRKDLEAFNARRERSASSWEKHNPT